MATDWQVSEVGDTCRPSPRPGSRRSVQIEWISAGTAHLGVPALLSVPHLLSREIKMNRRHSGLNLLNPLDVLLRHGDWRCPTEDVLLRPGLAWLQLGISVDFWNSSDGFENRFSGKRCPKLTCPENLTKKFQLWTKIRVSKVAEVFGSQVGSRTQSVNGTKRRPGNVDGDRACLAAWKRIALHTFRDRLEQLSKLVGKTVDVTKEWCCSVGQTIF